MSQDPRAASDPRWVDLAAERLGGVALEANDEFFAEKENLLLAAPPVFKDGLYTERGKWMDGWETRRRRTPGHDWCVIRLGAAGRIHELIIDTTHFRGNHPEAASVEAACLAGRTAADGEDVPALDAIEWRELLPRTPLQGHTVHRFLVPGPPGDGSTGTGGERPVTTHLRLRIYPDGGVARFRAYGTVEPTLAGDGLTDLAALARGAVPVDSSDAFFGDPQNLLSPGEPRNMGDGWETRRRRGPGHDWLVVRLAQPGIIERIELDTRHFKGNYPDSASLEAVHLDGGRSERAAPAEDQPDWDRLQWAPLLERTPLEADHLHVFQSIPAHDAVTHVRLHIYPDGGVARLRLWGRPA